VDVDLYVDLDLDLVLDVVAVVVVVIDDEVGGRSSYYDHDSDYD
jgi:hypothetical protein